MDTDELCSEPLCEPKTVPGVSPRARSLVRRLCRLLTWLSPSLAAHCAALLFSVPWRAEINWEEKQVLRAATAQWLRFGRRRLKVFTWRTAGPTVLLLHGWSSRGARLCRLVGPLLRAGFSVTTFDAPAHGTSSGLRCDVFEYRNALSIVMGEFAPVHGVIAHSLGARALLLQLAIKAPADFRAAAIVGIPPDAEYMLREFELVLGMRDDVAALMRHRLISRFGGLTDQHNAEEHAELCSVPVLVMHDVDDDVAPVSHAIELASQLPRGVLSLTRKLNHCGFLKEPGAIGALVAFMSAHYHSPSRGSAQQPL